MIQRLLKQQSDEKNEAYTRWRTRKCEDIEFRNKKNKAEKMAHQREERNKELHKDMISASHEIEL